MNDHNDLEIAAALCFSKSPGTKLNELEDQIRILELEVKLLNEKLDMAERLQKALESI